MCISGHKCRRQLLLRGFLFWGGRRKNGPPIQEEEELPAKCRPKCTIRGRTSSNLAGNASPFYFPPLPLPPHFFPPPQSSFIHIHSKGIPTRSCLQRRQPFCMAGGFNLLLPFLNFHMAKVFAFWGRVVGFVGSMVALVF